MGVGERRTLRSQHAGREVCHCFRYRLVPRLACLGISRAGKEMLLILWTHGGYLHVCEGEAASGDLGEQYIPRGEIEVNP